MLGFHAPELIIVLVVALLIFGPKKLPEMGSAIGKSIKEFQKGIKEVNVPKDEMEEEPKLPEATHTSNFTAQPNAESEVVAKTTTTETKQSKVE